MLDDLVLARDAGGLARAGADRVTGTLHLLVGQGPWPAAAVVQARETLLSAVERASAAHVALNASDPCATAAADSVLAIMSQAADSKQTAAVLRREARQAHGCHMADDSLRKREHSVLRAAAHLVFSALQARTVEELPDYQSILEFLSPFAELASDAVAAAADIFSKRAALPNDAYLRSAVAAAVWAVAQFGTFPVYALERLRVMSTGDFADESIEWLLAGIIEIPFQAEPNDLGSLATATRLEEEPEVFYQRLLDTPVMRPVVERFVNWLSTHDPRTCRHAENDVMIGYCGPHYYSALCEALADMPADYLDGSWREEVRGVLSALQHRSPPRRRPPGLGPVDPP